MFLYFSEKKTIVISKNSRGYILRQIISSQVQIKFYFKTIMKCLGFSSSKAGHNLLVSSFFVCFFFFKCIPESRHVRWSGGEEWNSGKVGCIMEMTTSAGSWSLSPQDQSLTKCTQNRSLEDLSMGIQLPFQEAGSEGSSFLCTCMWPSSCNRVKRVAPAQTWWRWQWHCRGGYVGEDFF